MLNFSSCQVVPRVFKTKKIYINRGGRGIFVVFWMLKDSDAYGLLPTFNFRIVC